MSTKFTFIFIVANNFPRSNLDEAKSVIISRAISTIISFSTQFRLHRIQLFHETAKTISFYSRSSTFPIFRCIKRMFRLAPSTLRHCLRCRSPSLLIQLLRDVQELKRRRGDLTAFDDECRHAVAQLSAILFLRLKTKLRNNFQQKKSPKFTIANFTH